MFSTFSSGVSGAVNYLWGSDPNEDNEMKTNANNNSDSLAISTRNRGVLSKSAASLPSRKNQTYSSYRHNQNSSNSNNNNNNNHNSKNSSGLRSHFKKKLSLGGSNSDEDKSGLKFKKSSKNSHNKDDTPLTMHYSYVSNQHRNSWHYYTNSNTIIERSLSPQAGNTETESKQNKQTQQAKTQNTMQTQTQGSVKNTKRSDLEPASRARGSAALLSSNSLRVLFETDVKRHRSNNNNNNNNINNNNNHSFGSFSGNGINSMSSINELSNNSSPRHSNYVHSHSQTYTHAKKSNCNSSDKKEAETFENDENSVVTDTSDPFQVSHSVFGGNDEFKDNESKLDGKSENLVLNYFDTLELTKLERREIEHLHNWVKQDKLSMKLAEELCIGDLVLSYFSHYSKTNPDAQGCWKRWIQYRNDNTILKDVNYERIREYIDTGVLGVGRLKNKRPVLIINSQYYDDSFGPEVCTKALLLLITSLLWDLKKDEFDYVALRRGISVC